MLSTSRWLFSLQTFDKKKYIIHLFFFLLKWHLYAFQLLNQSLHLSDVCLWHLGAILFSIKGFYTNTGYHLLRPTNHCPLSLYVCSQNWEEMKGQKLYTKSVWKQLACKDVCSVCVLLFWYQKYCLWGFHKPKLHCVSTSLWTQRTVKTVSKKVSDILYWALFL